MQPPILKLGYWTIRGYAQKIRLVLQYLGTPYQQVKHDAHDHASWFNLHKKQLHTRNPLINMPYLIDGQRVLAESEAIIVYVVHRAGRAELLGRDVDEQVGLAVANGVYRDFRAKYIELVYGRYGGARSFEQAKLEYLGNFRVFLAKLNALLEGREYYAGRITWVDFAIAEFQNCLSLLNHSSLQEYPNVLNHYRRIWDLPEIQRYRQSDRWIERPIHDPTEAKFY